MSEVQQAVHCQARPAASRFGYRQGEDALCASMSNTTVVWRGEEKPVCRMHEASYVRWGAEAEAKAREKWGWK